MVWGDTVTKLQTFVWIFKHVSRISYGTTRAFQECGQNREKSRYTIVKAIPITRQENHAFIILYWQRSASNRPVNRLIFSYDINSLM